MKALAPALALLAFAVGGAAPESAAADVLCAGKPVKQRLAGSGTVTPVGSSSLRLQAKGTARLTHVGRTTFHLRALMAVDGSSVFGIGIVVFRVPDGHKLRAHFKWMGSAAAGNRRFAMVAKSHFIGGTGRFTDSRGKLREQLVLTLEQPASGRQRVRLRSHGDGWASYGRPAGDDRVPVFCGPGSLPRPVYPLPPQVQPPAA
jgi:hypothetical protein